MKLIYLALLTAALGLLVVAPAQAAMPKLVGTVGPGFKITLKQEGGSKVANLKAGTYSITIRDLSSSHNFHLAGPGVNMKTSVGGEGTITWTAAFQKGKLYRFMCDPHASFMKGSFKAI
jgi:hypothetical protein